MKASSAIGSMLVVFAVTGVRTEGLLAPGVSLTAYGNGAKTVVNNTAEPFRYGGETVPAFDWRHFRH